MDRQTIYFGQVPLETDQLKQSQNTMVALAKLASAVLGTSTIVNGFTVTPTSPASLNVILTAGEVYQLENLEATAWSSLPANTTYSILKQGIQLGQQTFGITPPGTVGYSQVFLVEVQYQDLDSGALVLPYYNAANPSSPFAGPGNAGSAQNTVRQGIVAAQVKAGVSAATGSQVAPTADAGWTGLFYVTVANGATTITAGNITQVPSAPFIPATLPAIPGDVQVGKWVYAPDTGTTSNLAVTLSPTPSAYAAGMGIVTKVANNNTGAAVIDVNSLGNVAIVHRDGSALVAGELLAGGMVGLMYDGTHFQLAWAAVTVGTGSTGGMLTASQTYYVNQATGSDSNNGLTPTTAWQHIQYALNYVAKINLNGYTVTINVANGTYSAEAPIILPRINGVGTIELIGNTTTPSDVLVASTLGPAMMTETQGVTGYVIAGFQLQSSANNTANNWPGSAMWIGYGGSIQIYNIALGQCANYQLFAQGGVIQALGTDAPGGAGFLNIVGGSSQGVAISTGGTVAFDSVVFNITVAVSFVFFVVANDVGLVRAPSCTFNGAGNVTTTTDRYYAFNNGMIDSNGGGATYFPGTQSGGTTGNGGNYA
jgi:hypothetical protein